MSLFEELFPAAAINKIPAFDAWLEIWVLEDSDYDKALAIAIKAQEGGRRSEWVCNHCTEPNDSSFEVCWQCQRENVE